MNSKEAKALMKEHGHKFSYCPTCISSMIICGYCGNNTCNGGSGESCVDHCNEAYAIDAVVTHPLFYRLRSNLAIFIYCLSRHIEKIFNKR